MAKNGMRLFGFLSSHLRFAGRLFVRSLSRLAFLPPSLAVGEASPVWAFLYCSSASPLRKTEWSDCTCRLTFPSLDRLSALLSASGCLPLVRFCVSDRLCSLTSASGCLPLVRFCVSDRLCSLTSASGGFRQRQFSPVWGYACVRRRLFVSCGRRAPFFCCTSAAAASRRRALSALPCLLSAAAGLM